MSVSFYELPLSSIPFLTAEFVVHFLLIFFLFKMSLVMLSTAREQVYGDEKEKKFTALKMKYVYGAKKDTRQKKMEN